MATRGELREALVWLIARYQLVVADLTQVEFLDSAAIHALFTAHRAAQEAGVTLRLHVGASHPLERALEISGVLSTFDCRTTREEALA